MSRSKQSKAPRTQSAVDHAASLGSRPQTALRNTEQQLRSALQVSEERLRFESLLAEISGRFVILPGDQIDEEIKGSLEYICRFFEIDHSSISQVTDDPEVLVITHLFRDAALLQPPDRFEAGKLFPWCLKRLLAGEIVCLPSTRNAPPEAATDKQTWDTYQIRSTLAIPMATRGGKLVGVWGFDSTVRERDWPESLQKQLKLLAEVVANAIDRKLSERFVEQRGAELREAQRVARVGSWTRERHGDFKWSDEMYRIHGRDPSLGPPAFQEMERLFTPESWQSLRDAWDSAWELVPAQDLEIIRGDGSRGWISTRGEVERDEAGRLLRIRGTAQDITERKETEQKLREYAQAIEGAEEMFVVVDRDYRFVIANRAFLQFHQQTSDRVIGHSIPEVVNQEVFEKVIKGHLARSFEGQTVRFEATLAHSDQGPRTVFVTHFPIEGPRGVERVVAILQDITERKKAEEERRERESALREAQRIAHIGSWTWDPNTDAMTWSDEMFSMARWDRNVPVPTFRQHARFFTSENFGKLNEAAQKTLRTGVPYEIELEGTRSDGSSGWFISRGEAVYASDGSVDHLRGTVQDITERHLAEVALREGEERFRTIANSAPVMIWMAGPDGGATYVNKQLLEFTGLRFESLLGAGWAECIHPEDSGRALREYKEAFDRRAAVTLQYRLRRHDGQYRWVIDTAVPRFDGPGSFVGYIGSCVDDTERRAGEEAVRGLGGRLIQAQEQERKRIARELHDDINQRLAMLALELEYLRSTPKLTPAERSEHLEKMFKQTTEISAGVQALSHRLHSASLEYLGLAAAIEGFCSEFARHHKVTIDYQHRDIPAALPSEVSLALFRVAQEALRNAAKYSGVREFTVRLLGHSDHVQLTIRDGGAGFGLDGALHSRGLGLISMRERITALQGTLSIASKPKQGTEITAKVPFVLAVARVPGGR